MRLCVRGVGYCSSVVSLWLKWPTAFMNSGSFSASCSQARSGSDLWAAGFLTVEGEVRVDLPCGALAGALVCPSAVTGTIKSRATIAAMKRHDIFMFLDCSLSEQRIGSPYISL